MTTPGLLADSIKYGSRGPLSRWPSRREKPQSAPVSRFTGPLAAYVTPLPNTPRWSFLPPLPVPSEDHPGSPLGGLTSNTQSYIHISEIAIAYNHTYMYNVCACVHVCNHTYKYNLCACVYVFMHVSTYADSDMRKDSGMRKEYTNNVLCMSSCLHPCTHTCVCDYCDLLKHEQKQQHQTLTSLTIW